MVVDQRRWYDWAWLGDDTALDRPYGSRLRCLALPKAEQADQRDRQNTQGDRGVGPITFEDEPDPCYWPALRPLPALSTR
jgi:hypothetical protein